MATKTSKALFIVLSLILVSSALALSSRREEEERRELEQCKEECRQQPHYDQGLRRRCESRCEEKQQQEKERGGRDDDDESLNSHRQDPEQCLEQCKVRCCTHCGQRSQCLQRCQQEYEEEKRREQGRDESRQDPEKRLEQCKQKCRQHHQGQQQQWQCERQCQQEYEEEQSRQGGRDEGRQEEAERRFEQCKDQCRRQGREGEPRRWDCEQKCRQKYEEERGRQQGRDSSRRDPERKLEECRRECRERHQGQQQEQLQCQHRCQQRYEQEQQEQGRDETRRDPQERLEECRRDCRQQEGQQQQRRCEQECQREYKEEQQREQGRGGERDDINPQREEEEEQGKTERNPYVFQQESFIHRVRSEHGNIRILRNFAQKSKLLLGIANYRIAMLEANPNTFVVPHHFDADTLFYVTRGEGTITLIKGNQDRESHNIRQGDILKVSAGTIVYLINRSNNQKLNIAKILNPVSIPGQVEEFYTVGGQQPESYYRVFSNDLLEAALNTRRDQLERLFGQQKQGVIIKASQEQIREMSRHSSSEHGGHWPFGGESRGPYNLLNKRPTHSNQHGRHYEVDCNDYQPLRALNIQVSLANITGGSMVVPFFNSKATKIAIVTEGRGYFEMVCPHLSQQQGGQGQRGEQEQEQEEGQQQQGPRYQKVRSQVSKNTVFIVPPGHPVAIVADRNQNLEVLCFEVNAENNRRAFVAGRNNVVSKMEREAKELAFGVPSKLVDEVFSGRQQEEMFVRGPQSSQQERGEEEGRRQPLNSILEFAAGF